MSIDELKEALLNRTYPERVQISSDQVVIDVPKFLEIQFLECELWKKKDITKCPGHLRLVKFYEATKVEDTSATQD